MQSKQTGFTLIELIIVIVILGALAAVALPRFIDLQQDADDAALEGVTGAVASAYAINFAGCSVARHDDGNANCVQVSDCTNAAAILQSGVPNGYSVTAATGSTPTSSTDNGTQFFCDVNRLDAGGDVEDFIEVTAIAAGN